MGVRDGLARIGGRGLAGLSPRFRRVRRPGLLGSARGGLAVDAPAILRLRGAVGRRGALLGADGTLSRHRPWAWHRRRALRGDGDASAAHLHRPCGRPRRNAIRAHRAVRRRRRARRHPGGRTRRAAQGRRDERGGQEEVRGRVRLQEGHRDRHHRRRRLGRNQLRSAGRA